MTQEHHLEEGTSLLLADDDKILRERMARAFRDRGFDVRTASDAEEALRMAQEDSPELAVLDSPDARQASGLAPGQGAQRAIDPSTHASLVLTGYGSIATAIDAVRLGATYYLPKPADADDILAAFARGEQPHRSIRLRRSPTTTAPPRWPAPSGSTSTACSPTAAGNISEAAHGSSASTAARCSASSRSTRRGSDRDARDQSSSSHSRPPAEPPTKTPRGVATSASGLTRVG
jgi:two-component system response regulator RegA